MTLRKPISGLVPAILLLLDLHARKPHGEKLEHGVDVVRECAGDVRKNCEGVEPGDGRIKACMAGHLGELSEPGITALAEPKPEVMSDGVNAKSIRIDNSHLMWFIEIYLAGIDPNTGDIVAECYGNYAVIEYNPGKPKVDHKDQRST